MNDGSPYSEDIPDPKLIERLGAERLDIHQLIAILSRSYDYIRNLPLKGLSGHYSEEIRNCLKMTGNGELF